MVLSTKERWTLCFDKFYQRPQHWVSFHHNSILLKIMDVFKITCLDNETSRNSSCHRCLKFWVLVWVSRAKLYTCTWINLYYKQLNACHNGLKDSWNFKYPSKSQNSKICIHMGRYIFSKIIKNLTQKVKRIQSYDIPYHQKLKFYSNLSSL